jgi:DNA-binding CsgD family transcriptional regulator
VGSQGGGKLPPRDRRSRLGRRLPPAARERELLQLIARGYRYKEIA